MTWKQWMGFAVLFGAFAGMFLATVAEKGWVGAALMWGTALLLAGLVILGAWLIAS